MYYSSLRDFLIPFNLTTGGRSANKFRKSQIRKFADLYNLLYLRSIRKYGYLQICDVLTQSYFVIDSKLPQVRKCILFHLTNLAYNALLTICTK
jgi:hypothetical protein